MANLTSIRGYSINMTVLTICRREKQQKFFAQRSNRYVLKGSIMKKYLMFIAINIILTTVAFADCIPYTYYYDTDNDGMPEVSVYECIPVDNLPEEAPDNVAVADIPKEDIDQYADIIKTEQSAHQGIAINTIDYFRPALANTASTAICNVNVISTLVANNLVLDFTTVQPDLEVTLTFNSVTTAGDTCITTTDTGSDPSGFDIIDGWYYDINTTAIFNGIVEVCISYSNSVGITNEQNLGLLHWEDGGWTDITTAQDIINDTAVQLFRPAFTVTC
jgi:hypothetical protein